MNTPNQPLAADLPPNLREYLATVPPVTERDLEDLRKAGEALDRDPAFQADYQKSLFIERMLEAMEEIGETQSDLARRWNRSRQYVSKLFHEDKKVNFTIETLCELAHMFRRRIDIQVLREDEVAHVIRCVHVRHEIKSLQSGWDRPTNRTQTMDNIRLLFGQTAQTPSIIPSTSYDPTTLVA